MNPFANEREFGKSGARPFGVETRPLNNDEKPDSGGEEEEQNDQQDIDQKLLKKQTMSNKKPKKTLFKNPGFLGFEPNRSIDDQLLEPRTFKKKQE